jgi:hypothetical protein
LTVYNLATSPVKTLALNLNGLTDTTGITETGVTTLNVTTGGTAKSTLASFADTSLTTLNVSGTQTLVLTTPNTSLTTIAVSGAAGFTGSVAGVTASGTGLSFTTTSSGTITTTLHAAGTDTFTGSTGQDIITLTADQTKAVTGGSATNNELILANTAGTFLSGATHTWGNVTKFSTLGLTSASSGAFNAGLMGSNTINAVDVQGLGGVTSISNVVKNASLSIDASIGAATSDILTYQSADATGASDAVTLNLGTTSTSGITVGFVGTDTGGSVALSSLVMEDANQVGIGTLNVVSNASTTGAGGVNTIVALTDSGLSTLNVSGVDGLTITNLNEGTTAGSSATAATSFTVNNTSGAAVTIGTLTDSALGSLTFTGTGNSTVSTLAGLTGHVLTISNTGSGTATVSSFSADSNLTSLTLSGNVALNGDATPLVASAAQGAATAGVTVSAGTDNAHINLNLVGAGSGLTDSVTVGNANNFITDGSTAGTVNVTVGTGSNAIVLGTAATDTATSSYNVTLGSHTASSGIDQVSIGALNVALASITVPNLVVTGAVTGDKISFLGDVNATTTVLAATTAGSTVAATIAAIGAAADAAAHNVAYSVYGGNTYLAEANATGGAAATLTVIELVGSHTFTGAAAVAATASFVTLAS